MAVETGASPVRSHLTREQIRRFCPLLDAALGARASRWKLLGWSICGSGDAVEIQIKISSMAPRKLPASPVLPLPPELGGGRLRLTVAVTGATRSPPDPPPVPDIPTFGEGDATMPVTQPVAPGACILIGAGRRRKRGGIAAVVQLDGKLHVLTCGHLFSGGDTQLLTRRAAEPIAVLRRNYLKTQPAIDAAVCELLPLGRKLLAASAGAPTWLRGYLEPAFEDNNGTAAFWPTHADAAPPIDMPVSAYSATTTVLFPTGPFNDFIELGFCVIPGDSGSLLTKDDLYYGLCSGQVQGTWSYFTPIAAVLNRLAAEHREVALWHPDHGLPAS